MDQAYVGKNRRFLLSTWKWSKPPPLCPTSSPVLKLQPQNLESPLVKPVGSNVTLTLQVQADPPANVLWYFNGSVIQTNNVYQITTIPADNIAGSILYNTSLAIYSLDLSTQGYYFASFSAKTVLNSSAVFVTPEGKGHSLSWPLSYSHLPSSPCCLSGPTVPSKIISFTAVPQCITVGSTIQLVCAVYGYPVLNPLITSAVAVTQIGRNSSTSNTLTITGLLTTDATVYSCQIPSEPKLNLTVSLCSKIIYLLSTSPPPPSSSSSSSPSTFSSSSPSSFSSSIPFFLLSSSGSCHKILYRVG